MFDSLCVLWYNLCRIKAKVWVFVMKKFNKEELLLDFIKTHVEKFGYPPTVREMCRAVKVSSTSTISYYLTKLENGGFIKKSPNKNRALELIEQPNAKNFSNVTNIESFQTNNNFIRIPILGKITAGEPILAVENVEEYFMVSPNLFRGEGLFMLTVSGESMINAGIYDGDKIILRQQNQAENGDIVAAMIDGSATVKRFFKENGQVRLQPENETMKPIYAPSVDILGKVIGLVRKF